MTHQKMLFGVREGAAVLYIPLEVAPDHVARCLERGGVFFPTTIGTLYIPCGFSSLAEFNQFKQEVTDMNPNDIAVWATLSPAEHLAQAKERYALILERREVLNAELLALKVQIDALNYRRLCALFGLPENARLWVTLEFMQWVEQKDPPCWFVRGAAQLEWLYENNGQVLGQVSQEFTGIFGVPLDLILRMHRATLDQEVVKDGR